MVGTDTLLLLLAAVTTGLWLWELKRHRVLARRAKAAQRLNDSANDAMLVADVVEGMILDANPAACALLGYSAQELSGRRLPQLHPPELRERSAVVIADVWEKKGLVYSDLPFVAKDGSTVDVEISARVIEYVDRPAVMILARDIRERLEAERKIRSYADEVATANRELKEMQAQLVRSEQMASLGNLAAGIAHEINNPIGTINANVDTGRRAQLLLGEVLDSARAGTLDEKKLARAIKALESTCVSTEQAGERIAGIVRSLRNFARLDEAPLKHVDLHEGIDSALVLLQHRMGDQIKVVRNYGALPPALCNASQLNQVFMNVLINATEALPGAGTITITTRFDEDGYSLQFEDTGEGIDPGHLKRIFDPGFTTKGVGVGAGLGLSIAFRVLEEHGGSISAQGRPGGGARIILRLPGSPST